MFISFVQKKGGLSFAQYPIYKFVRGGHDAFTAVMSYVWRESDGPYAILSMAILYAIIIVYFFHTHTAGPAVAACVGLSW